MKKQRDNVTVYECYLHLAKVSKDECVEQKGFPLFGSM